ncbi:hypothetical protein Hanom_Chr06g00514031 [Helianthus anomalus]
MSLLFARSIFSSHFRPLKALAGISLENLLFDKRISRIPSSIPKSGKAPFKLLLLKLMLTNDDNSDNISVSMLPPSALLSSFIPETDPLVQRRPSQLAVLLLLLLLLLSHGLLVAIQVVNLSPLIRESLNLMSVSESEPLTRWMIETMRRRTRKRPGRADMEQEESTGARTCTYKCAPIERAIVEGNGGCRWSCRKDGNVTSFCGHEKRKV